MRAAARSKVSSETPGVFQEPLVSVRPCSISNRQRFHQNLGQCKSGCEQFLSPAGISGRREELLTSTLTLAEVLVKPLSVGDRAWADRYERLLKYARRLAAHLRSRRRPHLRPTLPGQDDNAAGCDPALLRRQRQVRPVYNQRRAPEPKDCTRNPVHRVAGPRVHLS